jgi:sporulation protein YlmC with PRC-barrel domain
MIEINIGAVIESRGQEVGRIERIVLDRGSYEATHLVIKHGGPLSARQILMPVGWVVRTRHDRVWIEHTAAELTALADFEVQHYARLDELGREELKHPRSKVRPTDWINYFVPLVANAFGDPYHTPGVVVTDPLLEPSESVIRRGLAVESSDGHKLGEVQEVLLSAPDWRLSGVIIERGLVLTHPMRIPGDWITRIGRDRIVLNRTREQVKAWEREQREPAR